MTSSVVATRPRGLGADVTPHGLSLLGSYPDGALTGNAGCTVCPPFVAPCVRLTDPQFAPRMFFRCATSSLSTEVPREANC